MKKLLFKVLLIILLILVPITLLLAIWFAEFKWVLTAITLLFTAITAAIIAMERNILE